MVMASPYTITPLVVYEDIPYFKITYFYPTWMGLTQEATFFQTDEGFSHTGEQFYDTVEEWIHNEITLWEIRYNVEEEEFEIVPSGKTVC